MLVLFTAALALRLVGIKLGLPSETGGLTTLHPDESVTFYSLERMKPSKLDFFPGDAGSWGTLHLYTVGALVKALDFTGFVKLGDRKKLKESLGEVDKMYLSGRALSALFGALAVVALYFIGGLFLSERAAFFSALLLVFSQVPMMVSYLVKPDSMMIFLALVSVYFSLRLLREPSTACYSLAGLFLGLAFITKYSAALLVFFPLVAHSYHAYGARDPFLGVRKLFIFALSGLAAVLVCTPSLFLRTGDTLTVMFSNLERGAVGGGGFKTYVDYFFLVLPAAFGWFLLPLGLAGLARWVRGPFGEKTFIAIYCVLFMVWAGASSIPVITYTLPLIPFVCLAAGDLAHSIFDKRWGRLLVAAVLAQSMLSTLYVRHNYISGYTIKEADLWLRNNVPPGSIVAVPKNDTWTPFAIRRHSGFLKIMEGVSPQSSISDGVAALGRIYSKADYVVLSEREYGFVKSVPEKYPAECAALEEIFSGTTEIKRFQSKLPFYAMPFNSGKIGQQLNFMNPDILVLKVAHP